MMRTRNHRSAARRQASMDVRGEQATERYGLVPPETAAAMSGLELLKGIAERRFPGAADHAADRLRSHRGRERRAVFEGTPAFKHYNPIGTVHGGYAATLLDSCMGCAVHTTLPKGVGYTTLEFKVSHIRPITADTGRGARRRQGHQQRPAGRHRRRPAHRRGRPAARARHHHVPGVRGGREARGATVSGDRAPGRCHPRISASANWPHPGSRPGRPRITSGAGPGSTEQAFCRTCARLAPSLPTRGPAAEEKTGGAAK